MRWGLHHCIVLKACTLNLCSDIPHLRLLAYGGSRSSPSAVEAGSGSAALPGTDSSMRTGSPRLVPQSRCQP